MDPPFPCLSLPPTCGGRPCGHPLPLPLVPLHVINVLFLNLPEFPLLPLGAQLESPAPRPRESAAATYHSGIYCVLRKTTKR